MDKHAFEAQARRVVFAEVRRLTSNGVKMKDIAHKAGVRPQTVSRLAYGETKYPRFSTVLGVLIAIGYDLQLIAPNENVVHMYPKEKRHARKT